MEKRYEKFKELMDLNGISGHEKSVKKYVKQEIIKYTNEIYEDGFGGVFGALGKEGPTIMLCGHMDEVGFIVTKINSNGMIKLLPIGGINPDVYLSQNMNIILDDGSKIKGIIGALPPHLANGERKPTSVDDLVLDIGASTKEEAISWGVKIGQQVVSINDFYFTKDGKKIVSKAWDDRFGVGMALEVMEEVSKMDHPNRVIIGGTVQEEVGCRGAQVATQMIKPDLFLTIDVSPADDYINGSDANATLGKGFLIRYYDPRIIMNRSLHDYFVNLCEKYNIKSQEFRSAGGTDAGLAQYAGSGTLATTLGLPGRYIHTTGAMVHVDDMEAVKQIALAIIKTFDNEMLKKVKDGFND